MATNYKSDPKVVEMIWQGTNDLSRQIATMYDIDHSERTLDALEKDDPEMYDFYYQLNDMAIKLANRQVMRFQQDKLFKK